MLSAVKPGAVNCLNNQCSTVMLHKHGAIKLSMIAAFLI